MPEGPTIVILREAAAPLLVGKVVRRVEGNTKVIDAARMRGRKVLALRSWGKHFLVCFRGFTLRVHFMLFGSYRIDDPKPGVAPRLALGFSGDHELALYACSVKYIEGDLDAVYDWRGDVMDDAWDPALARKKLKAMPDALACDALLDQGVFAGVGNIIKNEVLFRIRVHPLSRIGALPPRKLGEFIKQARQYSFQFLEWKKAYVLRQHWLAHRKSICPRCGLKFSIAHLGRTHRRAFFCANCQVQYGEPPSPPLAADRPKVARKATKEARR
jgi:endonuclease-8